VKRLVGQTGAVAETLEAATRSGHDAMQAESGGSGGSFIRNMRESRLARSILSNKLLSRSTEEK